MFGLTKLQSEIDPNAKDMGYEYISFFLQHCDVSILFMVMGALYVVPQVLTSKKLSPAHYGIIFLTIVFSFFLLGIWCERHAKRCCTQLGHARYGITAPDLDVDSFPHRLFDPWLGVAPYCSVLS